MTTEDEKENNEKEKHQCFSIFKKIRWNKFLWYSSDCFSQHLWIYFHSMFDSSHKIQMICKNQIENETILNTTSNESIKDFTLHTRTVIKMKITYIAFWLWEKKTKTRIKVCNTTIIHRSVPFIWQAMYDDKKKIKIVFFLFNFLTSYDNTDQSHLLGHEIMTSAKKKNARQKKQIEYKI